jgi:hypothetical protein
MQLLMSLCATTPAAWPVALLLALCMCGRWTWLQPALLLLRAWLLAAVAAALLEEEALALALLAPP